MMKWSGNMKMSSWSSHWADNPDDPLIRDLTIYETLVGDPSF